MLDAACPGQVFTSPTPDQMLAAAEAVDSGAGVLFIVKNYEGDVMNFDMAARDVGPPDRDHDHRRRRRGRDLDLLDRAARRRRHAGRREDRRRGGRDGQRRSRTCKALGERVNAAHALDGRGADQSCTVPAAGKPTFDLGEDEMEMGVGIHGEPGRRRVKLAPADAIAEEMVGAILGDLGDRARRPALLFVNGFGAHAADGALSHVPRRRGSIARGARRHGRSRSLVGNYVTSLDMAGCSITVSMLDEELAALGRAGAYGGPALGPLSNRTR